MKKQEYILWGLTDKELVEAKEYNTGRKLRYVFNEHGQYMYAVVRLSKEQVRNTKKFMRKINKYYGYKLSLFTKEEFGVA